MCLASCGRQHNYSLISVQIVGNGLRTTQREALRKSLLSIVTSPRSSQALNPLISPFYHLDSIPSPSSTCCQPSRTKLSWGTDGCSSLWLVEWCWRSSSAEFVPVVLSLHLLTCQGRYFFAVGSAFPACDPDFNVLYLK